MPWVKTNALTILQVGVMVAALLFNWGNLTGQTARDVAQVKEDVGDLREEVKGVKADVKTSDARNDARYANREKSDDVLLRLVRIENMLLEDRRVQGRR